MEMCASNPGMKEVNTTCCQNESSRASHPAKSDSFANNSMPRSRTRSQMTSETGFLTPSQIKSGEDASAESVTASALSASTVHQITTRSATGRLAKRPKRESSPLLSPPRKLGRFVLIIYDIASNYLSFNYSSNAAFEDREHVYLIFNAQCKHPIVIIMCR